MYVMFWLVRTISDDWSSGDSKPDEENNTATHAPVTPTVSSPTTLSTPQLSSSACSIGSSGSAAKSPKEKSEKDEIGLYQGQKFIGLLQANQQYAPSKNSDLPQLFCQEQTDESAYGFK